MGIVPVTYKRFVDMWNCIFVKTGLRSWVNIPGKCHTCLAIDKLRRSEQSTNMVKEACKQAHQLHRGGLFMLERQRFIDIS